MGVKRTMSVVRKGLTPGGIKSPSSQIVARGIKACKSCITATSTRQGSFSRVHMRVSQEESPSFPHKRQPLA